MRTYKVKKGDTLWDIAEDQLGEGYLYTKIKAVNGLTSDDLKIGQILKIPTYDDSISEGFYSELGRQFEKAIQDISELPSVKKLLEMLEG